MKKLISFFMCVCLIVGMATYVGVSAETLKSGDFNYEVKEDGTIEITKYAGKAKTVNIPGTINGAIVTSIGESAFYWNTSLTEVVFPQSIEKIDNNAFWHCSNLKKLELPKNIKEIAIGCFDFCDDLTEISIDSTNANYCTVDGVLFSKDMKTMFIYPASSGGESYTVPNGVEVIEESAFFNCGKLRNIVFSDSVTTLKSGAIYACDYLNYINITKNITNIELEALNKLGSTSNIYVDENNSTYCAKDGVLYSKDMTKLLVFPDGKYIAEFVVPSSVKSIEKEAFAHSNASQVTLQEGILKIGESAFYFSNIKKINLPNSLKELDNRAFQQSSLTSIVIPETITSLGSRVFWGCNSLKTAVFPGTIKEIPNNTFCASGLESITIKEGVESIGMLAFAGTQSLKNVELPASVKNIKQSAFGLEPGRSNGLESISMPGVESIEDNAFYFCHSLNNIVLSDSLKSIGKEAFHSCGFADITIPQNVSQIDEWSFRNCYNLAAINVDSANNYYSSIDGVLYSKDKKTLILFPAGKECKEFIIPEGTTTLKKMENSVGGIEKIVIPSSVTTIEKTFFSYVRDLKEITVDDLNNNYISVDGILYSKDKTRIIRYPSKKDGSSYTVLNGVNEVATFAFGYCGLLESIELPQTVTQIGTSAFISCVKMKSINIPESVELIDAYSFDGCSVLTSITIPGGAVIGEYAFDKENLLEIKGFTNSDAERFAKENDITFISLGIYVPTPKPTPVPTIDVELTPVPIATATPTPTPKPPKKSIKFKKKKVTIKVGKKVVLKVTIKGAKKAKFSVNKKGKKIVRMMKKKAKSVTVKGKKKGKATITAKAAGKRATCKVTVKKKKK